MKENQGVYTVKLFLEEGRYISRNQINHFLNYRKNDMLACFPLITDPVVKKVVSDLLAGEVIPKREGG